MRSQHSRSVRSTLAAVVLLLAGPASAATVAVNLTAAPMTATLRDGTAVPMWGFCTTGSCTGTWAQGPTITATAGDTLNVTLTNGLPAGVQTSLVILGQLGGGLGSPVTMVSPIHRGQVHTTFPGNGAGPIPFTPPAQGPRVRSFGTEVGPGTMGTLTWSSLKPGTYLYESGTLPSLQVPMGLYGLLVVNAAPGVAYASAITPSPYAFDADVALLFSEIDPVQNRAVAAAAAAGARVTARFNDPACAPSCYPAAVNYTPTAFLINGQSFDPTTPQNSAFALDPAALAAGRLLVRLANAGSRTHVPTFVGLPMAIVAEDGNALPGRPRALDEVLLTAGKTHDAMVSPQPAAATSYGPGTFAVFDRALSLSTANKADGGMQGFLLVGHTAAVAAGALPGAPGMLPAAVVPLAVADAFAVPYGTTITGDVTLNDIAVSSVALAGAPGSGKLALASNGRFTYTPASGVTGPVTFSYSGNGGAAGTAVVTLTIGTAGAPPLAAPYTFTSTLAGQFSLPRPGLLASSTDPGGHPLTAALTTPGTCTSVTVGLDGSFQVAAAGSTCQFTYAVTNSLGIASTSAQVTVNFGAPSGLAVSVVDAVTPTLAIADYRWTLQEDLTFRHDLASTGATPAVNTRTVGTSFHRSHMTVVATGCVGPVSCGQGQTASGATVAMKAETQPGSVALDPARRYYLSILPGDAGSPPGHVMGGAEVRPLATGGWAPITIRLQSSPIVTAQMSIYIYEDSSPTNGQDEPTEGGLGGFNVILMDPAGRTGDVAGQQTYDAFNMPLSNALLGRPGCPDELNAGTNGTGTSATGNLVGAVYTCPSDPNEGTPAADPVKYALAGHALIKNLTPARYDVIAHPGAAREGAGEIWWQTETLEGTPAQDAFVGINEPVYFQEFGPPGPHTTIGFVNPIRVAAYAAANGFTGTHTVTGRVTNQHMSHPSDVTLYDSASYAALSSTTCRVVLNSQAGIGPAVAAAECAADGSFTLRNVPDGTFDLAVFDQWLDQIIQNVAVTVPVATATVALGDLQVLSWFTQYDQNIFLDANRNGIYDVGEKGISNVPLTVRFRNGAPSNVTLSDSNGNGILVELFPLFNWYVAEADTTRYKQTGVTVVVDGGGPIDTAPNANPALPDGTSVWTSHYATGESSVRTEVPGGLSYGLQGFIGQRNRVDWGRTPYVAGENGGITGYVVYSSTRPFDDMRFNVQTIWEPLVPRVKVNLYQQLTLPDGTVTLKLFDSTTTSSWDDYVNLVQGLNASNVEQNNSTGAKGFLLGSDNVLRDPATGVIAAGLHAGIQLNLQCPGQKPTDPFVLYTLGATDVKRCYDGWHDWNQVQGAPYDGRYVFPSAAYAAAHPLSAAQKTAGQTLVSLPIGTYVVEAVTPPGYQVVKEEDKNILIGDAFVAPATQQFGALASIFILPDQATLGNANPNNPGTGDPGFQSDPTTNLGVFGLSNETTFPECVGALHRVPDYLSLYPQAQQVAPFAGMDRALCDRKRVLLNDQMQASATFFVYTEVPAASNDTGIILDDASSEFNAAAPDFGEKASVPFVPVSVKDFAGVEMGRTYSDQWGAYNMLTPSSWLVNPPTPSGYGPNMLVTCINDPGPILDTRPACTAPNIPAGCSTTAGQMITDPAYNPSYSNFCYTNPFMPGQTTYLDTPVLPIAAFAAGYNPVDCAQQDSSPVIKRVDSSAGFGPWLGTGGGTLTITAQGDVQVPNPAYAGPFALTGPASQTTITRHYGFGGPTGTVSLVRTSGGVTTTTPLSIASWSDLSIVANVPNGTQGGELVVTTAAGLSSVDAVTVTVEAATPTRVAGGWAGLPPGPIQQAVDAAKPGDLILVDAGTYSELVIMWKPVRLQGVGAGSVIINAAKYPTSKLEAWRPRINALFSIDATTGNQTGLAQVDPLPGQEITGGVVLLEPSVLGTEEGAGVTVLAKNLPAGQCTRGAASTAGAPITDSNFRCKPSRIDGISVTGGDAGGGIYVNGWAHGLEISNNRVYGNAGAYHGGVRVGVPYLEIPGYPGQVENPDGTLGGSPTTTGGQIAGLGFDVGVRIHHNAISKNGVVEGPGGQGGAGGGVSMCAGSDGYSVDHNWICGNYSQSDGGGVGHLGFSQNGTIAFNQILFNQTFQQTASTHGGGIFAGGEPALALQSLTLGTGRLTIDANVIRGNLAEAGHGGGIRLQQVNGADVQAFSNSSSNNATRWNSVTVTNNLIDNNVAGWAGGGLSLSDTVLSSVVNNTIASNDSVGIAGPLLAGGTLPSTTTPAGTGKPNPAGIASERHSAGLIAVLPNGNGFVNATQKAISSPTLFNDVIWRNRSFYFRVVAGNATLCSSNVVGGACASVPDQATTGQCTGSPAYWDLGVLGDTRASATIAQRLTPTYSVLTAIGPYAGTGNTTTNPGLADLYCNGSRVVPEFPGVINPPSVMNLQVAATVDEGNNYVNLRYGPLYLLKPTSSAGTAFVAFGNYHLGTSSPAINAGSNGGAPNHDVDNQVRPLGGTVDIGADEVR